MDGREAARWPRVGAALVVAALLGACAAPEYSYIPSGDSTSFVRVPSAWTHFKESAFEAAIYGDDINGKRLAQSSWTVGFDASPQPSADHVVSMAADAPAVYYAVRELAGSTEITADAMRDMLVPVTQGARLAAAAQGQLHPGFELLADQELDAAGGVRGVQVQFSYLIGDVTQTFAQKVFVNKENTRLYILLAHCSRQCFTTHSEALEGVVSSFTVRP